MTPTATITFGPASVGTLPLCGLGVSGPTATITSDALVELLDERYEAKRDRDALGDMLGDARAEISHLRADVRAFRGGCALFAVALIVSIIGHALRSAL